MTGFLPRAILLVAAVVAMMLGLNAIDVPGWMGRVPQLVVATVGTVWAARQFQSSDPPRRGWMLLACAGPLALIIAPLAAADVRVGGVLLAPVLIVVNNGVWLAGALSLLRVLLASGLAPPWTRTWIVLTTIGALTTLAEGATVVLNLEVPAPAGSLDGTTWAVRRIVGVVADIVVFNAALQMLRITYPMRRGLVATPYLLLALTAALFMLVVLGLALATALLQTELGLMGRMMDTLAWCSLGLAGFAQARTLRHTRSE